MSTNFRKSSPVVATRRRVRRMALARRGGAVAPRVHSNLNAGVRLLVSNLGSDVTIKIIDEKFGHFGKIIKVVLHHNMDQVPIGTAEVWMSTLAEAKKVKTQLNATDIFGDGRIIRIEKHSLLSKGQKFWNCICDLVSKVDKNGNFCINEE